MMSWEMSLLTILFNNKKLSFSVPQMQNMLSKMCISQSLSVSDLFVSQELAALKVSESQIRKLKCGQCKIPEKTLEVTVYEQNCWSC